MNKVKRFWAKVCRIRALKYIIASVIAVVLIGFVDENSLWHHVQNTRRIEELNTEIARYTAQHQHNMEQIRELDRDPHTIMKIARERYFMKTQDEDIFVLSDDNTVNSNLGHEDTD